MTAITSYADLKSALADRLDQDEGNIDADLAIDLAEARINRILRVRNMETAFSDTIASGVVAVPTGFRQWRNVYIDGTNAQKLTPVSTDWIYDNFPTRSSTRKPLYIAEEAGNFIFGPYPDSTYTVKGTYYKEFDALSDSNTSNWLVTNAPDVLFYGALSESWDHLGDEQRRDRFEERFLRAIRQVEEEEEEARYPWGVPVRIATDRTAWDSRPA